MARIETPKRIRGTQDIFGDEQRRFAAVLDAFDRVRRLYCFQRVEVPVFEATGVFARSLGETSDVVSKEMYTFPDKGGDMITLRPEFTAGIARAFITEGWQQHVPLRAAAKGAFPPVPPDRRRDHWCGGAGGGCRIARAGGSAAA
jgi:histidyl-tRNA synthetase